MISTTISGILGQKGARLWSISPEATVYEAIQIMAEQNIGAVLVMQGAQLVGMLSERDYARQVALKGRTSRETRVREILAPPVAVRGSDTVEGCMKLMTQHRVRHLPVMDGERVIGIVSIGDLVNWVIRAQETTISQLEGYISGQLSV